MKLLYLDLETTGLDPRANGVWQIAGKVVVNGEAREIFCFEAAPLARDVIDPAALFVNGKTTEELLAMPLPKVTKLAFDTMLSHYVDKFDKFDKFYVVGYNVRFDMDFLRAWYTKLGDKFFGSWFWHPYIDVMTLAAEALKGQRHLLPDFKLGTVARHLGIASDPSQLHAADYDIELTEQVYKAVTNA